MLRFLFLILLSLSVVCYPVQQSFSLNVKEERKLKIEEENSRANEIFKKRRQVDQCCLACKEKRILKNLKEAKEYLRCLLRERKILIQDFYGLNLTAYRYVNIFDRLGYIRYRIRQVDKEIKKTKFKISELKKEINFLSSKNIGRKPKF